MELIYYAAGIVIAYVVGSIPFAYLISKIKRIDIRKTGSKNPGAANVTGHVGKIFGVAVFLLDALKAAIPVFFAFHYTQLPQWFLILFSVTFIMGHDWSIFLKFNGGKGVSTSLGIAFVLFPIGYLEVFPIVVVVSIMRKETNFGSFLWFLLSPLVTYFIYRNSTFSILSVLIFLIYITRRITYMEKFSIKTMFNRIVFDRD